MIPDTWMHFFIMLGLIICSMLNKSDRQFVFILCIYAVAWQVSDYLSRQENVTSFFKLFFQSSVSIALIHSIVLLKHTRFTRYFGFLLFIGIAAFSVMVMTDEFALNSTFNYAVDVFGLLNIQLIHLELLALAGITFDMGNSTGGHRKSFKIHLYRTANTFIPMGSAKEVFSLAQERKGSRIR